jgi:hypothetical protein
VVFNVTDDQLPTVLAKIAEIEKRPGYEGPKIGRRLQLIRISAPKLHGDDGEEVFEDRAVGAIWRAVKAHWNPKNHLDDWMIDIEDGGDSFVVFVKDRLGHKIGVGQGALALAAARAYLAAIGGDER